MPEQTPHVREEIHELLDNCLSVDRQTAVEQHLAACDECQSELDALRWTKQLTKKQCSTSDLPAHLRENILQIFEPEDLVPERERVHLLDWQQLIRPLLLGAIVLICGLFFMRFYFNKPPELPIAVTQDYVHYASQQLALNLHTSDPAQMEQYFAQNGIPFETRVFDLGMMKYSLVGGRVHQVNRRDSALFVYKGEGDKVVICQMYRGQTTELPDGATIFEHKCINFFVYQRNNLTVVFWDEGPITCAMVSEGDTNEVLQLAFAKAQSPHMHQHPSDEI